MSIAYDWDLIERLLHEVQNGAGHSFTPRPYAEQHAAAQAAKGEPVGDLDHL
ncbi:MAG: transcriptional regulator, partial [Pseudomonas putida]